MMPLDSLNFRGNGCLVGKVLILSFLAVGSQIALWRLRQKNAQLQRELNQYQAHENLAYFQALADVLPLNL